MEIGEGPLTPQQKTHIRDTWSLLYTPANRMELGVEIFVGLFTKHPDYRKFFRAFKDDDDIQKLAKTAKLKAHAYRVVASINNLIQHLDDPDVFVEMVKNLARSHHGHNVPSGTFMDLGPVLLDTFGKSIGDKFTQKASDAWLAAYTFIVTTLSEEYGVINGEVPSGGSSPEK